MRDLLPDLLHERLDAATRAEVARHVASCPACAAELELLRSMRAALAPAPAPRVDVARIAAAVAAARPAAPSEPNVRPLAARRVAPDRRRVAWQIAAAVVVAAVGTTAWAVMHRQTAPVTIAVNQVPPHETASVAPAPTRAAAQPVTPHHAVPATTPPPASQMLASTGHHGLVMDGGVNDLSDGDVRLLLQSLDSLTAIPDADPAPMTYQIDDDGGLQ
jgi:anti-sigma factor RsiW